MALECKSWSLSQKDSLKNHNWQDLKQQTIQYPKDNTGLLVSIAMCPPLELCKFLSSSNLLMHGGLHMILMRINEVLLVLQNQSLDSNQTLQCLCLCCQVKKAMLKHTWNSFLFQLFCVDVKYLFLNFANRSLDFFPSSHHVSEITHLKGIKSGWVSKIILRNSLKYHLTDGLSDLEGSHCRSNFYEHLHWKLTLKTELILY